MNSTAINFIFRSVFLSPSLTLCVCVCARLVDWLLSVEKEFLVL